MKASGIILSGGESSRMGVNKAFIEVNGKRIIDATVELFGSLFPEVIIVTNTPLDYAHLNARIAADIIPQKGSLGGIYTGLFYSSHPHSMVVACDIPFIRREVIEYLVGKIDHHDVVIPHLSDGFHPLHAIYSRRCLPFMERLINEDNLKIINFFKKVRVREVKEKELSRVDPDFRSFVNINTPEDVRKYLG
ncbi:MAG: molybdenum cofactor guanylyltransferase [Proteobacteria bacterium]|nr:molybdenum cofactor guanylyltransferase [Pseudomonadota bacterium]